MNHLITFLSNVTALQNNFYCSFNWFHWNRDLFPMSSLPNLAFIILIQLAWTLNILKVRQAWFLSIYSMQLTHQERCDCVWLIIDSFIQRPFSYIIDWASLSSMECKLSGCSPVKIQWCRLEKKQKVFIQVQQYVRPFLPLESFGFAFFTLAFTETWLKALDFQWRKVEEERSGRKPNLWHDLNQQRGWLDGNLATAVLAWLTTLLKE